MKEYYMMKDFNDRGERRLNKSISFSLFFVRYTNKYENDLANEILYFSLRALQYLSRSDTHSPPLFLISLIFTSKSLFSFPRFHGPQIKITAIKRANGLRYSRAECSGQRK